MVGIRVTQSKNEVDVDLKTWMTRFNEEKATHERDVSRFNVAKNDLIVSTEEANSEALRGFIYFFVLVTYICEWLVVKFVTYDL